MLPGVYVDKCMKQISEYKYQLSTKRMKEGKTDSKKERNAQSGIQYLQLTINS